MNQIKLLWLWHSCLYLSWSNCYSRFLNVLQLAEMAQIYKLNKIFSTKWLLVTYMSIKLIWGFDVMGFQLWFLGLADRTVELINDLLLPFSAFGIFWASENFQTGFTNIFYTTSKYFLSVKKNTFTFLHC